MAIQTNITLVPDGTQEASVAMYEVKEFLKTIGWTVAGSSDGATGGMDAVDRIVSSELMTATDRWFVLQSPHVTPSDRIQLLFSKPSTQADEGAISYNPNADYAGATIAVPTSSYEVTIYSGDLLVANNSLRYHMLADDASPYGFASLGTPVGTFDGAFSLAFIPLDVQPSTLPGKPYVVYAGGEHSVNFTTTYLCSESTATSSPRCVAEGQSPPQVPTAASACRVHNLSGQVVPNGTGPDPDGKDQTHPVIFQTTDAFYGTASFMRWNGNARNRLDTLEDDVLGARGRIVFGDVNFPWDGVTAPITV